MGFRDLLGKELLFFDGATGTMLQALGLQPGELPELWNFTHAAEVQSVHEAYLNNGSNIVLNLKGWISPLMKLWGLL